MELTGAEIVVRCLKENNVEYVFGYPGGAVLHLYDALSQTSDDIRHILVRHEQGATHAADGYARATGKPGVVLLTSGPGATNGVTGIATAYMDSIPMVVITGQVTSGLIGNDAFQEVDTVGITRPCVKHNFLVRNIEDLPMTMAKAFYIATTGRPGPVVIDIPKDVTVQKTQYNYPKKIKMRSYNPSVKGHAGQISKALDLLLSAKQPVLYAGGGIVQGDANKELTQFARLLNLPVTLTLMGLGGFPASDKQFLGMLGMHGTYEANMAMHDADVILAIGARFDDRVTSVVSKFCPNARIIHIDVDPSSISKNVGVEIPLVGSASHILASMIEMLKEKPQTLNKKALDTWWKQINEWRKVNSLGYIAEGDKIKPQFVIETLHRLTKGEAIITSDVGQHQMWSAQYYGFDQPRRWVNSGGLGTMGFGLPAAMGAKLGNPDRQVCCITGDGSIQMMLQELATMKQFRVPVIILNLNNGYLGMVRQWQELFYEGRYSMSYMEALPDFVKLAEAYGHTGVQITRPDQVEAALKEALAHPDRTTFIDVLTDPTQNVYPMIPAGAGHNEMILAASEPTEMP